MDVSGSSESAAPPTPAVAPPPIFSYDARGRDALRLILVNAILTLLTLGLYRFFAKTRFRRFLWNHTAVDGDRFEYLGTWDELLIGLLIVAVVFVPVLVALALAGDLYLMTELHKLRSYFDLLLTNFVPQLAGFFVLFALAQAALYRARRYRLSRTVWRGIRAGQNGSSFVYGSLWVGLTLVAVATAGLMLPLRNRYLFAYRLNHTWLGDQSFKFEKSGISMWRLWSTWLLCWPVVLGGFAAAILLVRPLIGQFLMLVVPLLVAGVVYCAYKAAEFRFFASRASVAGLRFETGITGWRVFRIYFVPSLMRIARPQVTCRPIRRRRSAPSAHASAPTLLRRPR